MGGLYCSLAIAFKGLRVGFAFTYVYLKFEVLFIRKLTWLSVKSWTPTHYATSRLTPSYKPNSPRPWVIQAQVTSVLKKQMEGLIPFVYRAIMQYKNGNQVGLGSWYCESPSASYMRLPGDSGRFQTSDLFQHDYGSMSMVPNSATSTKVILSTGVQSPVCRLTTRRVAT